MTDSSRNFNPLEVDLRQNISLEASAGTGKTYSLERIVCELITSYGLPVESILVVTFTNKAARELRERIRALLTERSLKSGNAEEKQLLTEAKHNFDKASIYTIHAFCQHVLETWPFESGSPFSQEFLTDRSLMDESVAEVLYQQFCSISEQQKYLVRSFFSNGIDEGRDALVKEIDTLRQLDGVVFKPEDSVLEKILVDLEDFQHHNGALWMALEELSGLTPTSEQIFRIIETMGTGQREPTALKIQSFWTVFQNIEDLFDWMRLFFKGSDKKVPAESLCLITEEALVKKSEEKKKNKNLEDLEAEDAELVRGVSALFDALKAYEGDSPSKTHFFSILKFSYLKLILEQSSPVLAQKKLLKGARDFSDLINLLYESLMQDSEGALAGILRKQYKVVLVDEFQDTDKKQWGIFHTLFDRDDHNYILIGDPKQSIYGFRGADLSVYFNACDTVDSEQRYSLSTNYRSRREMVESCNYMFSRLFSLPVSGSKAVPFDPVLSGKEDAFQALDSEGRQMAAFQFCAFQEDDEQEQVNMHVLKSLWMDCIADEISRLLSGQITLSSKGTNRRAQAGDIAILMERNDDCEAIQALLGRRGISSVIFSERKIMESREALVFSFLLHALVRPESKSAVTALLISSAFNMSPEEVIQFRQEEAYEQFILFLKDSCQLCDQGNLMAVFRNFFESEIPALSSVQGSWRNRLLKENQGKRACTNLSHLAELFHNEQRQRGLDCRELYDLFVSQMNDNQGDETRQVRLDQDGQAVQILTHHSSKGLEFPIVFFSGGMSGKNNNPDSLSYSWEDQRYKDYLVNAEAKEKAALSDWEERKRLYYVSFTRASVLLYLPWSKQMDFCQLTSLYTALVRDSFPGLDTEYLSSSNLEDLWPFHIKHGIKSLGNGKPNVATRKNSVNTVISSRLKQLAASSPDLFHYKDCVIEQLVPELESPSLELQVKRITTKTPFRYRISRVVSFSSLTAEHSTSLEIEDDADRDNQDDSQMPMDLNGVLGLTRGAQFGNLVHCIFEEIDYKLFDSLPVAGSEAWDLLEERSLRFFDQSWFKDNAEALALMVYNVINCPLETVGPLLHITEAQRKHELEFLLSAPTRSRMHLDDWHALLEKGYLKGFIDLIFIQDGKLYIADWKTTVPPGPGRLEDYLPANLDKTMMIHRYDLQARIYAYALRQYMLSIKPEFDYETEFGGVYYFFVRGMGDDGTSGVHFSRPAEDELLSLISGDES